MKSVTNSSASPASNSASYFVDQKKGEVNELKQLLKNINAERDIRKKRDIIKKVIAYMTLGIDVSRLFSDMIMAIESKDIVMKKMVYLYLCNYAHKQPDMALMCINTLRRDCDNEDPMVRGLALRSLCNLRLESVQEYVEAPLRKALNDISPYVRKTGVMGVLKLSSSLVESGGYIDLLYDKLQDGDTMVITNTIFVLDEILIAKGGIVLSSATIMYLLARIGEFSEWGLNAVLDLLARYTPSSEDEVFAIMNQLDPVLRSSNCGSILATLKCFLHLTAFASTASTLQTQVYIRVKPPLLTMITGGSPELQYVLLKHLETILLQPEARGIFDDEYRQLFVRHNESSHVKYIKVAILPLLANASNAREIADELSEYVIDVDMELCLRAINSLADVALRVAEVSKRILEKLVEVMDFDIEAVQSEAVRNMALVVRKYGHLKGVILPSLPLYLRRLEDSDARSVIIWILGEYASEVVEAPYLLEPLIDAYSETTSTPVKIHLLTATMKCFFARPPEVWAMLGRLLRVVIDDYSDQDVHDRALFYYRLLRYDLHMAEAVCRRADVGMDLGRGGVVEGLYAPVDMDQLLGRFNTLAVVYGKSANEFVDLSRRLIRSPAAQPLFPSNRNPDNKPHEDVRAKALGTLTLLDMDMSSSNNHHDHHGHRRAEDGRDSSIRLQPDEFQTLWSGGVTGLASTALVEVYNGQMCRLLSPPDAAAATLVSEILANIQVSTIASGPLSPPQHGVKFFLYSCRRNAPSPLLLFLLQLVVEHPSGIVTAVIKTAPSTPENHIVSFVNDVVTAFAIFEIR